MIRSAWRRVGNGPFPMPRLNAVIATGASSVTVGDDGSVMSSNDGERWAARSLGVPTVASLLGIASPAQGSFIVVGVDELILTSP